MTPLRMPWAWVMAGLAMGVGGLAQKAAAQGCATCGSGGGHAAGGCGKPDCGHCGLKKTPVFDKLFIKRYCAPTICPGSCYGHFQTKWTPWQAACPEWTPGVHGYDPNVVHQYPPTMGTVAPGLTNPGGSDPIPAPRPAAPKEPLPMPAPPKKPAADGSGLSVPPVPVPTLPAGMKSRL